MEQKTNLIIDYKRFCEWYFDDETTDSTIAGLIKSGFATIKNIANSAGYLPIELVKNKNDIKKEDIINNTEIEMPGEKYDIVLEGFPTNEKYIKTLIQIAEQIGFKLYSNHSLLQEEVGLLINNQDQLLNIIFDPWPDEETIESIKEQ